MTYLTEDRHHRLMLREVMVHSWDALNPTEHYMTLPESWINRADDGTAASSGDLDDLRYHPGFYNLALMDLFGFVHLEEKGTEAGKGWHVTRITRRPFGEALLRLVARLRQERVRERDDFWEDPDDGWTFDAALERLDPEDAAMNSAVTLDAKGPAPQQISRLGRRGMTRRCQSGGVSYRRQLPCCQKNFIPEEFHLRTA